MECRLLSELFVSLSFSEAATPPLNTNREAQHVSPELHYFLLVTKEVISVELVVCVLSSVLK